MIITYNSMLSQECLTVLKALMKTYQHILPTWLNELYFVNAPVDGNTIISCETMAHYRKAYLHIRPPFMAEANTSQRERNFVHELCHIPLAPMVEFVADLTDRLLANHEPFRLHCRDEWVKIFEGIVQDVQHSFTEREKTNGEEST